MPTARTSIAGDHARETAARPPGRPARSARWRDGASTRSDGPPSSATIAREPLGGRTAVERLERGGARGRRHRAASPRARAARRTARASPRAAAGRGRRRSGGRSTRAPRPRCPRSGRAPGSCRSAAPPSASRCPTATSTIACASSRARRASGIIAPEPTLTSMTSASRPAASFLDRIEPTISGIDSTVPVASRIAYSRRSAGARRAVWPTIAQPTRATTSRRRSGSSMTS